MPQAPATTPPHVVAGGAIVLCGGASRRMTSDKAALPFGSESLLERAIRLVSAAVPNTQVVVVAGRDQQLPQLPQGIAIVRDLADFAGPLPAIAAGLAALPPGVQTAFVTGCDSPFLRPEFVTRLLEALDAEPADGRAPKNLVAVPADDRRVYPLSAAYHRDCLAHLLAALAAGESSPQRVLRSGRFPVLMVDAESLRAVDPELDSLTNCNTPEDYQAALARMPSSALP